ncbi:zinc finger protein 488 [Podarcis muralis]
MELTLLTKEFRTSDNRLLPQHFPDVLATVHTTQEIPEETILGPCLLHDAQLDTVAFIALKCSEKRNIHYVIKVDATSVQNPGGFPWMRLVQPASNKKEQNLEAYLRNSQLYYRPTRKIHRNEELLVWYDEELSGLLGFNEIKASRRLHSELDCPNCKQVFKWEHPFLSHARFLCFPENSAQLWRNLSAPKTTKSRLGGQPTNFHSLARDLEFKMAAWKDDSHGERRMNCDDVENGPSRKAVLLEKTNHLHGGQHSGSRDEGVAQQVSGGSFWKLGAGKQMSVKKDALLLEQKESAFTEVRQIKEKMKMEKAKMVEQGIGGAHPGRDPVQCSPGSAFSFVWPNRGAREPKSAFSKPARCQLDRRTMTAAPHPLSDLAKGPGELSGCVSAADVMRYSALLASKFLASDLNSSPLLPPGLVQRTPYTSGLWPRQMGEQRQATSAPASSPSSASLTLLPPTFTSFSVAAQNWCAKCNLSFRMTSDLVFHMRCHHKKEGASPESPRKRRREEKLTCPVCQEYFRERHHLSRHMTSHN